MVELKWNREKLEELTEDAFTGSSLGTNGDGYRVFSDYTLAKLLKENHDISAYLALSAFIEEAVDDIFWDYLNHENASNQEEKRLTHKIDLDSKVDILKIEGVIEKKTADSIREFKKYRNSFAHEASSHVYSEKEAAQIRKAFSRGLYAYETLLKYIIETN